MNYEYKVMAFTPTVKGCAAQDKGWNPERCKQFESFLTEHSAGGWRLHSSDYRQVTLAGCGGGKGAHLVCVFEKQK